jgi:hypothetical protein
MSLIQEWGPCGHVGLDLVEAEIEDLIGPENKLGPLFNSDQGSSIRASILFPRNLRYRINGQDDGCTPKSCIKAVDGLR